MKQTILHSQHFSHDTTSAIFLFTEISPKRTAGFVCQPFAIFHNEQLTAYLESDTSQVNRVERLEINERKRAALARARRRVADWVGANSVNSDAIGPLAQLRMSAGLSQRSLANILGTHQSNVSRFEKSPGDPQRSTIRQWAEALKTSDANILDAIDRTNESSSSNL